MELAVLNISLLNIMYVTKFSWGRDAPFHQLYEFPPLPRRQARKAQTIINIINMYVHVHGPSKCPVNCKIVSSTCEFLALPQCLVLYIS